MNDYIPISDTLDMIMHITPDSVEALRLQIATRSELLEHIYNLAYITVVHADPECDKAQLTTRLQTIAAAQLMYPTRETNT